MKYSEMVKSAVASGKVSEKDMWQSVARVDGLLDKMERENPTEFWKFMRDAHEDMYGPHYNREYAEYDLSQLRYTDASGNQRTGAHWTEADKQGCGRSPGLQQLTNSSLSEQLLVTDG